MVIIVAGIAIIAGAAYGIFMGYTNGDWTTSGIGWIALVFGTLVTLYGFGKRASEQLDENQNETAQHAQAEIRALVQALGVVAVADSKLRDQEIDSIARIHEQMLGIRISHEEIREILSEFGPDFDITQRLVESRAKISPTMKRLIVQSCHLVMVSDMEVSGREENRIHEIGLALGFDQSEINDLIASAGV